MDCRICGWWSEDGNENAPDIICGSCKRLGWMELSDGSIVREEPEPPTSTVVDDDGETECPF